MITKFKLFESERKPEVGDFVLLKLPEAKKDMQFPWLFDFVYNKVNFINNNIGKIVYVGKTRINVEYDNIPKELTTEENPYFNLYFPQNKNKGWKDFSINYINEYGKTKEEIKMRIIAKEQNFDSYDDIQKYNL